MGMPKRLSFGCKVVYIAGSLTTAYSQSKSCCTSRSRNCCLEDNSSCPIGQRSHGHVGHDDITGWKLIRHNEHDDFPGVIVL